MISSVLDEDNKLTIKVNLSKGCTSEGMKISEIAIVFLLISKKSVERCKKILNWSYGL